MKRKRPLELPERLAVLLLEELTDIHAIVQTIADMEIQRLAREIHITDGVSETVALKEAAEAFRKIRGQRSKKFLRKQLGRLNLPCIDTGNPPPVEE
jgi:hypothetical protein